MLPSLDLPPVPGAKGTTYLGQMVGHVMGTETWAGRRDFQHRVDVLGDSEMPP